MPQREWHHPDLPPAPGFSRAVEASGRTIYLGGQVPTDDAGKTVGAGDMAAQADACFGKIAKLLEAAGGTMNDIVKLNFYVTDMGAMGGVRDVRAKYFTKEPYPAMTGVEVGALANPEWLIEIDAIAVVG